VEPTVFTESTTPGASARRVLDRPSRCPGAVRGAAGLPVRVANGKLYGLAAASGRGYHGGARWLLANCVRRSLDQHHDVADVMHRSAGFEFRRKRTRSLFTFNLT
jgi:hypothetical protein